MFVGEGPGRDEDLQGEPFVGRAGQLRTTHHQRHGTQTGGRLYRQLVKCRPPENRNPGPDEVADCEPFLFLRNRLI